MEPPGPASGRPDDKLGEIRERSVNMARPPRITLTLCPGYKSESLPHTKPHHEALADLHGVAVGGADARLVVDAGGDEGRAAVCERCVDELVELLLIAGPGTLAQSRRAG